jgi:pimeloyl-ACP methyl ester carboxylesterase
VSAQKAPTDGAARFLITVKGVRIGTEVVDVAHAANSIKITSSGQLAAPFELTTSKFEMTYSGDWQPVQLAIEGVLRGQIISLGTSFGLTTAVSDMMQAGQRGSVTHTVSPRAVVLPNYFFGAYEALAARLGTLEVGGRVPVFVAPDGEVTATVDRVTPKRIVNPSGATDLRQFDVTIGRPGSPSVVKVSIDDRSRLARLDFPAESVVVIRDDIAGVMSREEKSRNPGDDDLFIPASGFSLGATITKPANASGRAPAVVLVGGPGRQPRDEEMYGMPIFGQLAGQLANAGYFVVRYDKRGLGQSGGRVEHAAIADYADDIVQIVMWLRKRPDVDPDRLALIAFSEGAASALVAASREKRIDAVVLLNSPGKTGRDVTMEQQQRLLARVNEPEPSKQQKVALQTRINDAVVTGKGWDDLPPDLRKQADTPWFKSWLLFDPATALDKVSQPVLILHGALDTELPPSHADRLEQMAQARKKLPATSTKKVVVPGVNHILIPAKTGEIDEYESLPKTLSPDVASATIEFLKTALTVRK